MPINMKSKSSPSIQPVSIVALVGLLVALFLVGSFNAPGVANSDFYKEGIAEVGFTWLLFYWLYTNRSLRKITVTFSATRLFLAGLLLLAGASVFWAVNIDFFISKYLLWLATAAIFLLTLTLPPGTRTHIVFARGLVFAASYVAIIGLAQVFFALDIYTQTSPPASTFVNKNMASHVIVLVFPLGCFLLCVDKNKHLSRIYPFALALMIAYIFHTDTRAAWLSMALEGFLIALSLIIFWCLIWDRKKLKAWLKHGHLVWARKPQPDTLVTIGCIVSAIVLLLLLVNRSAQGWSPFADVLSAQVADVVRSVESYGQSLREAQRYKVWDAAFIMIANNPLAGTGMGSFFYNLITQAEKYRALLEVRAHNDVLELGVELGVIGWILLLGVGVGLSLSLYRLITQSETQQKLFYVFIAIALAGSALNMQFSFPYQMPVPLMLFGLYAALIVKADDRYNTKIKTIELSLKPIHWNIGLGFVGVVVAFTLVMNFIWLGAMQQMTDNIKKSRWQDPVAGNTLMCHKTIVKTIYLIADKYTNLQRHKLSLGAIDSFAQCAPDTWLHKTIKSVNLSHLRRYHEAIKILEQAKQDAPAGKYADYVNQLVAYGKVNDRQSMLRTYQQLSAKPEAALRKNPKILQKLTRWGLKLQQPDTAEKFYRLHQQYHAYDAKFESQVGYAF